MSDAPAYGLSWDGHNIYAADKRSIDAAKAAIHKAAQIEEYRQEFLNRHEAQAQEIERLRANLAALEDEKNTYIDYVGDCLGQGDDESLWDAAQRVLSERDRYRAALEEKR